MSSYTQKRFLPYTPDQLFALVAAVDRDPEFLPWCRADHVLAKDVHLSLIRAVVPDDGAQPFVWDDTSHLFEEAGEQRDLRIARLDLAALNKEGRRHRPPVLPRCPLLGPTWI
jgi:hypothetical protein